MPFTSTYDMNFGWIFIIPAVVAVLTWGALRIVRVLAQSREATGRDPRIASALEENATLLRALDQRLQQIEKTLNEVS